MSKNVNEQIKVDIPDSCKRPYQVIKRRKSRVVSVGDVKVGGNHDIVIQSMTNTETTDVDGTVAQIQRCVDNGAELMRVSVPDVDSARAMSEIVKRSPVPIIADIHYHYKRGIDSVKAGAKCIRINPGTLFDPKHAREIVSAVKDHGASIRIGINSGSIESRILEKYKTPCPEALVESAMDAVRMLEEMDFFETKISVKASDPMLMIKSYELLAKECDYPLHLGVTEAGSLISSSVRSSIGIGSLLLQGIGDTIRVSASIPPEDEIPIAYEICKSLNLRARGVTVISCPSCARQQFDVIKVVEEVEKRTAHIREPIVISILGCVVNGLGEAAHSIIGVTGAGSGNHLIYRNGNTFMKSKSENLVDDIVRLVEEESDRLQGK
ncbi:flavodoxin-dependent (E)-4-hydroxy-3-methylbut-2-enyl-diphosphate synthase [Rickettsiales bacterium]|nr:flavodoxin-dependent (E)-4-hydroxy-3-methylbut-2-enyl-diphosphate synthase [Rickettsiales bacterium]